MPNIVTNKAQVVENAKNFNKLTTNSDSYVYKKRVFNSFIHWYYFKESDIFAPSKFIGYENTTLENYRRGEGRHGSKTETVLEKWFNPLEPESSHFEELSKKLHKFVSSLDRKLKQNYRIHIEKSEPIFARDELDEETDKIREKIRKNPDLPLPSGVVRPQQREQTVIQYARNPQIRAWVLEQAGDTCELCSNKAPFIKEDGTPFLEIHHIKQLSQRGPDILENTVALCPNCHRHLHYGKGRNQKEQKLRKYVKRRTFK